MSPAAGPIPPDGPDGHADQPAGLPAQYTTLPPFAEWFATGDGPALMYHKLGPRPRGVRLKGLYVGAKLFQRQLAELAAAGFRTADFDEFARPGTPAAKRVVLSFDDGFENVLRHGLGPLRAHGFRAVQFLVAGLLGRTNEWEQREGEAAERLMDAAQVREWLAAGHAIGAHTCTHPRLTRLPLAQAREEIQASRARLEDEFGVPVRHFCYPFGDWNPAVRDAVEAAGFATACTTAPGLNRPGGDPHRLRRLTARHASRNWRNFGLALRRLWAR